MNSCVLMIDFEYIKIDRNAYRVGYGNETYNIITSNIKKIKFCFLCRRRHLYSRTQETREDKVP